MSNTDPWTNRAKGMKCASCIWYVAKSTDMGRIAELGRCRRHSPTMNGYPVVFPTDWCGDHKLDEEKIVNEKRPFTIIDTPDKCSSNSYP